MKNELRTNVVNGNFYLPINTRSSSVEYLFKQQSLECVFMRVLRNIKAKLQKSHLIATHVLAFDNWCIAIMRKRDKETSWDFTLDNWWTNGDYKFVFEPFRISYDEFKGIKNFRITILNFELIIQRYNK